MAAAVSPPASTTSTAAVPRVVAVVAAPVAALATWVVVTQLLGADLRVSTGGAPETITALPVLVSSAAAALAGWGWLALLERLAPRVATRGWLATAAVVYAGSLVPVVTGAADTASLLGVAALHTVVAGAVAGVLMARRG